VEADLVSRDEQTRPTRIAIPVGLNLTSVAVPAEWWLGAAQRAEAAGFESVWIWDHFVSRGRLTDPMLECWSMLAAASVATTRVRLGSFVSNVMNRHPSVLARIVATVADLSGGRLELGIGAGGHPAEHEAYGIPFPARPERAEHLREALDVLRLLLAGGPADYEGERYRLRGAHAFPVAQPTPRLIVGGETAAGARFAARHADAWTCHAVNYDELLPTFEAELRSVGRARSRVPVLVGVEVEALGTDLEALTAAWQERGAAELIVHDVKAAELDAVLAWHG
jgi:alkanesulfonate monooxygenase SsuD/methylene tetrahydromethanopterin reductase-like flavin-dependent oxidoreductase (luciferase family)